MADGATQPRRTIATSIGLLVLLAVSAGAYRYRHRLLPRLGASSAAAAPADLTAKRSLAKPRSTSPLVIGYNLDLPGDWSEIMPFLDLMHDARPWSGGDEPDALRGLSLDDRGWVRSLGRLSAVTAIVKTGASAGFVGHTWVVSYRGEGTLTVDGMIEVLSQRPGEVKFRGRAGNVWLTIRETDPRKTGDYIRDITVVREDRQQLVKAGKIFNPDLLSFLAPFRSLRFMDWMLTNDAPTTGSGRWAARSKTTQAQWRTQFIDTKHPEKGLTPSGYPAEIMVALANELGAHPHFNMPATFDDDYAREFAKLVRDRLRPDLVATVEYSNEVWNWSFPQATFARHEAEKLWPGEGSGWVQFMGARTSSMCRIWKQVFVGQPGRLRCLIAPQTGWPDIASASLDCPRWVALGNEPCHKAADAIAITGYFSGHIQKPENAAQIRLWLDKGKQHALSRAFRQLEHGDVEGMKDGDARGTTKNADSLQNAIEAIAVFAAAAESRGLGLYIYEGGTHFDHGPDEALRQFLVDVGRDARMGGLYRRLFDAFEAAGGTVFNVWGGVAPDSAWANAANLLDRTHPKYRAVVDFTRATRPAAKAPDRASK